MKTRFELKRTESIIEFNKRKKELDAIKNLVKKNKLSKAISEVNKFIYEYPDDYYGKFVAASIYDKLGDTKKAEELYIEVTKGNAKNCYSAYVELGKINESNCNLEKAEYYYLQAVENSPYEEIYAIRSLARVYRQLENYYMAEETIKKLPDTYDTYYKLEMAKIKRESNDIIAASILLSEIETVTDSELNREIFLEKARVEKEFNCFEQANIYLDKAKDDKVDIIYWKCKYEEAEMAYQNENYQEAEQILDEIMQNKVFIGERVTLLSAKTYEKQSKIQGAKNKYKIATNSSIKKIKKEATFSLAEIYLEEGNFPKAREYYSELLDDKMYKKTVYYRIIAISIREKKYQEANFYLNKIKNMDENNKQEEQFIMTETYLNSVIYPTKKQLGTNYINNQIINYDPIKALNKIKSSAKTEDYTFYSHIDLDELFLTIPERLKTKDRINSAIMDIYDLDYPNIGHNKSRNINTLRVILIPNTNHIIALYPCEANNLKDLIKKEQPQVQQKEENKVKKLESPLEKFIKKYNINI